MGIFGDSTWMFRRVLIDLNNRITRARSVRVAPGHLLLLAPRCLQHTGCDHNLGPEMLHCQACGRCNIGELVALGRELGIICRMAAGGREALAFVKDERVRAVVAVACEKELFEGICASLPKPVLGVYNQQNNGPCRDTSVDMAAVRRAITAMLEN
ncbi:MAG: DUF116 domain-containing protein [Spartobacteria bacterium]|nr:DUF116 domain-containing protein [Spartobacteria bacterium]